MNVTLRQEGDVQRLEQRVRTERTALQRDRCRGAAGAAGQASAADRRGAGARTRGGSSSGSSAVRYTLQGVYDLLHRLNLSCLVPRPRHRKNDPPVMKQWLDGAPLLSAR